MPRFAGLLRYCVIFAGILYIMAVRSVLLGCILGLSALIAALHLLAIELYWYWTYLWFDILVHFLGGFLVALGALWLVFYSGYLSHGFLFSKIRACTIALGAGIVIGILWELFEVVTGPPAASNYALDTSLDMLFDVLGAYGAYLFVLYLRARFAGPLTQ